MQVIPRQPTYLVITNLVELAHNIEQLHRPHALRAMQRFKPAIDFFNCLKSLAGQQCAKRPLQLRGVT